MFGLHMKRMGLCAAALLGIALCAAPAAKASTVIDLVSFNVSVSGSGAPANPVTGSFGIIFDPTMNYSGTKTGIAVFTPLNINIGEIAFNYDAAGTGVLSIYGTLAGTTVIGGTDDFALQISDFKTSPFVSLFFYSQVGYGAYTSSSGTAHVQQLAPTPIPGSLLLLASAMVGLTGFAFLKRRSLPAPAVAA
jgi:hypothetical protein